MSRQAIYDAVKRVREEGEAWVTLDGVRLHLTKVDPSALGQGSFGECLVRSRRPPGVARAFFTTKDAWPRVKVQETTTRPSSSHTVIRTTGWDDVLALVAEEHGR